MIIKKKNLFYGFNCQNNQASIKIIEFNLIRNKIDKRNVLIKIKKTPTVGLEPTTIKLRA